MQASKSQNISWFIISPAAPTIKSSIGAHALNLCVGLEKKGLSCSLFCPPAKPNDEFFNHVNTEHNFRVHYAKQPWSKQDLDAFERQIKKADGQIRLFLQFDPASFTRPWNHDFTNWIEKRKLLGDQVWTMMHKPPSLKKRSLRGFYNLFMQHRMTKLILRQSSHIFVATPSKIEPLRSKNYLNYKKLNWLPVPSNVPYIEHKQRALNLKKAFAHDAPFVLGTFGSFLDAKHLKTLERLIPSLLINNPDRIWLCIGRGGGEFVANLRKKYPDIAQRIEAAGELDVAALSAHIQACDIMIQPYSEGVDTSRTSIMVGLSHKRPVVTNSGSHTEMVWHTSKCVAFVTNWHCESTTTLIDSLIRNAKKRRHLSQLGSEAYQESFSLNSCINTLLSLE